MARGHRDDPLREGRRRPALTQAQAAGLLPDYHDCLAFAARLRGAAGVRRPQPAGEAPAG